LIRTKLASESGPDVLQSPCAIESFADDLAEWRRYGGIGNALDRFPLSKPLEEHGCEIAHVALLGGAAFLTLRRFADAVAAQLDHAADGKDIARLDVLVNEAMGVQHIERCHQAGCQLRHILDSQMALVKDLGQIRVHLLEDCIDYRAAIELRSGRSART